MQDSKDYTDPRFSIFSMNKKGLAMKHLILLAALIVAALTPNLAHAQDAEPPSAPAIPLYFQNETAGQAERPLLLSIYCYAMTVVEFADPAKGGVKTTVDDSLKFNKAKAAQLTKDLNNLPDGMVTQLKILCKDPMDTAPFDKWQTDNGCEKDTKDENGMVKKTPGCEALDAKIAPILKKSIDNSTVGAVRKGNALNMFEQGGKMYGRNKLVLRHLSVLAYLPMEDWPVDHDLTDPPPTTPPPPLPPNPQDSPMVGQSILYLKDGQLTAGEITAIEGDGIVADGETKILFDDLDKELGIIHMGKTDGIMGDGDSDGTLSYAEMNRISTVLRVFSVHGPADGYDGLTHMIGVVPLIRFNMHNNVSAHVGIGVIGLIANSTTGVDEKDSSVGVTGIAGLSFLLGSRDWVMAPVLETNMTWQFDMPGVQAAVGAEFFPGSPFDLRALVGFDHRPTGRMPYVHRRDKAQDVTVTGISFSLEAGFTW